MSQLYECNNNKCHIYIGHWALDDEQRALHADVYVYLFYLAVALNELYQLQLLTVRLISYF